MWLGRRTIASKLLTAFGLSALVTVGVGVLGKMEAASVHSQLDEVLSDNLPSMTTAIAVRRNVSSHLRDAYHLIGVVALGATAEERKDVRDSLMENRDDVTGLLDAYLQTPQSPEELEQAKAFQLAWGNYLSFIEQVVVQLDAGDAHAARRILNEQAFDAYRVSTEAMKGIIVHNEKQSQLATEAAASASTRSSWILGGGIAIAVLVSITFGLWITRLVTVPIYRAVNASERIAKGDLTQELVVTGNDESAQLLRGLAAMQDSLRQTVTHISDASGQLASAATQLHAVARQSSADIRTQNGEIQQAATAVTEMSAAVDEVARNAVDTSEASTATSRDAEGGRDEVSQAISGISAMTIEIVGSAEKVTALAAEITSVGEVLNVIRGIAEQTNLLALNAAIEAARAGEQGRGFAVVADEVRALAHRTQKSTSEIEKMISGVRNRATEAVSAMGNTQALAQGTHAQALNAAAALERIVGGVSQMNERNLVIASASEEQAQVAREVDRNLTNIQDLSNRTYESAHQLTEASEQLKDLSGRLKAVVGAFQC